MPCLNSLSLLRRLAPPPRYPGLINFNHQNVVRRIGVKFAYFCLSSLPVPQKVVAGPAANPNPKPSAADQLHQPPIEPVVKDHSYGTRKDKSKAASQETPQMRIDHLYSARRSYLSGSSPGDVSGTKVASEVPSTSASHAIVAAQRRQSQPSTSAEFSSPPSEKVKLRRRTAVVLEQAPPETKKRVQVLLPLPQQPRRDLRAANDPIDRQNEASAAATGPKAPVKSRSPPEEKMDVPRDHLYSSAPPSPQPSPSSSSSKGKRLSAAKKKKLLAKKKKHSIQALGHSYAAARPRRFSETNPDNHEMMYPCDQCEKTFPQPYRLNRHIREVHLKEKQHYCSHCDKAFFKLTSKQRHELTHTEHTQWRCKVCAKVFRDQSSLKYHEKHKVCARKKSLQHDQV